MVQRSATLVVSSKHGLPILSPQYTEGGPPIDVSRTIITVILRFVSIDPMDSKRIWVGCLSH